MTMFIPLRVRSHGSLLHGTASPDALIARALELGYPALALTDRDNLYLAIAFYRAARAEGLAPILGAELSAPGGHAHAGADRAPGRAGPGALLLALDRRGYANLCALLTARHLEPDFDLVRAVAGSWAGLHVVVESPGLAAALLAAGVPAARGTHRDGPRPAGLSGGLWMGLRGLPAERAALGERVAAAHRLRVPLVATGECAMLHPHDRDAHRIAVTAAAGELLERMPPAAFAARDAWLASPAEWERRVRAVCAGAGVPEAADEALANNAELAARCRLEIELGVPIFPRAPLPPGTTGPAHLRRLCEAGVRRRFGGGERPSASASSRLGAARARLSDELAIIERLGFTDYFLLVAEIVGFARSRGIPTVGRGSGAGSIVAYVLGITNVDPLRYGLYFERFLHPSRRDCPDLDIDLCWKRRDEVIAHVYETYGRDRVAMISTHATLGARSAFRETAKALGVPNARVNALARRIPRELEKPYLERLERLPESRAVRWREPPLAEALRLAGQLDGAPRHLSVHCGGIVIADRPLTHYVPLEEATKGVVVTQFEMRAIERIGLVKMDLLGNRALTTIGECIELARRAPARCGGVRATVSRSADDPGSGAGAANGCGTDMRDAVPDLDHLPDPDPLTAARVSSGDTLNCFQLESPAMRHLLRMLDVRTLDDTIAAVALVRPGPAGAPTEGGSSLKELFCRRHRGLEPAAFLHPSLEPVLRETHGLLLYEEDVMRVAAPLAGLSLAEGDDLRRAIAAARDDEEFRALERGFVGLAARRGVTPDTARAVWRDLARFAAYAFCKAHAAGYGTLGWQSAYLKARFPTEWAVVILNHHAGMYPTWVHVEDLRRGDRRATAGAPTGAPTEGGSGSGSGCGSGVTFLPPCVNRSAWDTTLEVVRSGERRGEILRAAVRVGLGRVFGLAAATGARIMAERASRPFRNLADLGDRVRPALPEVESLVLAGALDWTGRSRPSLLLEARVAAGGGPGTRAPERLRRPARERPPALVAPDGSALAPEPVAPVAVPELPEFDLAERVRGECRATGLWFSAHPLDVLVDRAALAGATPAAELAAHAGRRVTIAGLPCAHRRVETRSGGTMLFLTLADRTGLAECALFPDAYRACAPAVRAQVVRAEGRVDETLGAVTLAAERVTALA
ncbi:MAG: DNA polymerase III subunit alpha [Candidatus Eisenbacteria bacterium]|nr:DNA polymerase III subunit alpha [Candidatus Eisenbacteria bacterium]